MGQEIVARLAQTGGCAVQLARLVHAMPPQCSALTLAGAGLVDASGGGGATGGGVIEVEAAGGGVAMAGATGGGAAVVEGATGAGVPVHCRRLRPRKLDSSADRQRLMGGCIFEYGR